MYKRIVGINGGLISHPEGYHKALDALVELIDNMESEGVDRSDMSVALNSAMREALFHLTFLEARKPK